MGNIDIYGGRKFILAILVVLLSTGLIWFGRIDGEVYKYLVLVTAGSYMTSNVVQKSTLIIGADNAGKT